MSAQPRLVPPPSSKGPVRRFSTVSDMEIKECYGIEDLDGRDPALAIGRPGAFPYTRGIYPTMYRGRAWTMRQFAGFGTPRDTNERFKFLLAQGQTGLSTAFDMPTLMGYDADHERALGEVGREGTAVSTIDDMAELFDGIALDEVTTSMTVNCSASVILAMYFAVAERRGIPMTKLGGTIQNDMLKEFIAQKEWISPPAPSVRIIVDMIEFCTRHAPRFHPVSISGYHIREAGSTAVQEVAFTLADGIGYVQAAVERGLDVDAFAPRLSFFFNVHNDFLEEIAKLRAARRLWARLVRDRFGAENPRSLMLRTHAQTAGCSLTAQQPLNNIVRVAIQALAGVLGGVQSLHTNSMDETLALPSEQAVMVALRTQQIIAEESGVTNTVDPLGGSWAIEALTDRIEAEALDYIERIDRMGGIVRAIELGFPQKEIAEAAYRFQQQLDRGEKVMVGVNRYQADEKPTIDILRIHHEVEEKQAARVRAFKAARDQARVAARVGDVRAACRDGRNLMPFLIDAVRDGVTLGEICDVYRDEFGVYRDPAWL
ncbi:MAG: methylmalonyl-CoA mutase [Polyangiaceae bacterium UTPRO1]|jgi:methylmalonyl-CoA mutase N-terminal domain/subunit|nr:methylmalonyl-CoA mutase family protein [Myxococcales bacterium]OQY65404.1 MAG: methylmalonyl-CoA mutase [Polyangiaceae bacterium UTPRO1]